MSKQLARALQQYFDRGFRTGAMAMSLVTLVSLENVMPDFVEDEKLSEVFNLMEEDMERVWNEARNTTEPEGIGDYLIGIVEQIRKKRGMGGIYDDSLQV